MYKSAKTYLITILHTIRQERTCQLPFKSALLFLHLNPFMLIISPEQIKSLIRRCTLTAVVKYLALDKRHVIVHYMKCHSTLSYLSCYIDFLSSNNNTSTPISISSFHCTEVGKLHHVSVKVNKALIAKAKMCAPASDYLSIQYKFHNRIGGYSDGCVLNKPIFSAACR